MSGFSESVEAGSQDAADLTRRTAVIGIGQALAAYLIWGCGPIYWKALRHVPALEVLGHRIVWSALFLTIILLLRRIAGGRLELPRGRRKLLSLAWTTLLISLNWLVFIWAISNGRLLEASLGYYINPLLSVGLGMIFLRERHGRLRLASFALAGLGVVLLTLSSGKLPWIALVLATSFAAYGLLRKLAALDAAIGLACETLLLAPLATGYLIWLSRHGLGHFAVGSALDTTLLALAGILTAVPLLCFTSAAPRLRLGTLGLLQYITPTAHFGLAVLAYAEPFTRAHLVSFLCIWTALGLYAAEGLRAAPVLAAEAR